MNMSLLSGKRNSNYFGRWIINVHVCQIPENIRHSGGQTLSYYLRGVSRGGWNPSRETSHDKISMYSDYAQMLIAEVCQYFTESSSFAERIVDYK